MDEQKRQLAKEEAIKKGIERGVALMREDIKMYGMKAGGEKIFICEAKDYDSLWEEALKNIEKIPKPETEDKVEEYLNNWKRERADFLNYKKEESRRVEEFVKYANEDLVMEMMELVDDLEIVAKEVPGVGLEHVVKKFSELFKKYGVERISVDGQFNPALHEAVAVPSEAFGEGRETEKEGTKMVEVRAGYMMRDKVIRPARVKIVK